MTPAQPVAPAPETPAAGPSARALRAGLVAGIVYGMIGWRSLLVPTLIRSIEHAYGQSDAGMGLYFLATAMGYAAGSLTGGTLVRGLGSRVTLTVAALVIGVALVVQGMAPPWVVFLPVGVGAGVAAAASDVAINTLFLDLFPQSRGRALNLLHLAWSVAAMSVPVAGALLLGAGVTWSAVVLGSGIAWLVAAVALVATVPSDARDHAHGGLVPAPDLVPEPELGPGAAPGDASAEPAPDPPGRDASAEPGSCAAPGDASAEPAMDAPDRTERARRLPPALLVMGVAIGCYVAAEASVSDWLIRVLDDLPLATASLALTLFWGGIAVGRAIFAKVGNRVDPMRAASAMVGAAGGLVVVALAVPGPILALALFGGVGVALGPVFPLIVAAAGARMPGRTATVTTVLTFAAVLGAVIFPPSVGFLSGVVGLRVAMLGAAALAVVSAIALRAVRRMPGDRMSTGRLDR